METHTEETAVATANGSGIPAAADESTALLGIIEKVAMSPDADITKLEKMLDMQERILDRNAKQAFASSFARMQAELPEVLRRGKAHSSTYAKFEDINEAVRPVLSRYGFAVSFRIRQDEKIRVIGVLSHQDGHTEETEMVFPADTSGSKNNVQAIGSSVSYGKRYVLCALLNISTRGEDDDAQATSTVIDTAKAAEIDTLIRETGSDRAKFLDFMRVKDVREIRACDYKKAINALNVKKRKGGASADA